MSRGPCRRSGSNHRCCYDFRFRDVTTQDISDSSKSCSGSSSVTSGRKRKLSSFESKNDSSGYGCSHPKKSNFENVHSRYIRPLMYFHNINFVLGVLNFLKPSFSQVILVISIP